MKIRLPIIVLFLFFLQSKSQIVFCPVGATWSYEFSDMIFSPSVSNHKITCTGSYFDGNDTIKTLLHTKFYLYCNGYSPLTTLIKQKGDTIFFSNAKTQNTWQILYNFAAQAGQGWLTTFRQENNNPITLAYLVDSVRAVSINGFNLRRLYVNNGTTVITERLGNSGLLFNFPNSGLGFCDGDYFHELLCYSDLSFGTKQFSAKPCDFSNLTEVGSLNKLENSIHVYPNPCSYNVNIVFESHSKLSGYDIYIVNLLGDKINLPIPATDENNSIQIDLSAFSSGIYFIQMVQDKKIILNQKIIKE